MAATFQYQVVEIKADRKGGDVVSVTPQQIQAELTRCSKDGWELFSIHERTMDRTAIAEASGHSTQVRTTFVLSVVLIFKKGHP